MLKRVVATCSQFFSITCLGDLLGKLLLVCLVGYANFRVYQVLVGDKSEENYKKIQTLSETITQRQASKARSVNKSVHITKKEQVSRRELYDIIGVGLENFYNADVVSTTVDSVSAREAGLVDYEATPLYAYKVHVVIQGLFQDLAKFYASIEQRYAGKVLWNELVFDSGKYPKNQGAISFYVLAK